MKKWFNWYLIFNYLIYMHFVVFIMSVCMIFFLFNKLWDAGFEVFEVFFVPSHTSTYLEHFAHIHTVRRLPQP